MELVADTNILLAALLKPSVTQKLLFSDRTLLFVPEHSLSEIKKHSGEFARRMGKTKEEFETALCLILSNVKIIPSEEYVSFKQRALSLCPQKHRDDWPFLALALSLGCPLWSNDKALKKQGGTSVYSTSELLQKLK